MGIIFIIGFDCFCSFGVVLEIVFCGFVWELLVVLREEECVYGFFDSWFVKRGKDMVKGIIYVGKIFII